MTSPVWLTGFEYGVADPNANGGGLFNFVASPSPYVSIISTDKNTGTYCLKLAPDGTNDAYVRKTLSTPTTVVGRQYFKVTTNPAAAAILTSLPCTTSANTPRLYVNPSTNVIELRAGSTVIATGPSYTTNVWYRVDWSVDVSANPWVLKAQIDGGTEFSGNSAQAADSITGYQIGTSSTAAWALLIDDVVVSTTGADYPIGAGGTESLLPTSDGTHNAGTNIMENQAGADIGVVTAYDLIDDIPITTATTYIQQLANGTGNYAEVQFGNITATHSSILGAIGLLAYTSATTTTNKGGCVISKDAFSTSTTIWGASGATADYSDGSTANLYYKSAILANVTDDTTVNALTARMGYSDDAAPDPYWVNLLVEVAYAISSGTNYTRSAADSVGITDVVSKKVSFFKTLTNTEASTDSLVRTETYLRSITTTEAISDLLTKAVSFLRSKADSVGITDIVTSVKSVLVQIANSVGVTDTLTKAQQLVRAVTNSLGITDSTVRTAQTVRQITDSEANTTALAKSAGFTRTIVDITGITDLLATLKIIVRSLTNSVGITDVITKIQGFIRSTSATVGITDTITNLRNLVRAISTTETYTDVLTKAITFVRSIANSTGITDVLSYTKSAGGIIVSIADTVGMTDSLTRITGYTREILTSMTFSDIISHSTAFIRNLTTTESVSDTIAKAQGFNRSMADSLGITDVVSSIKVIVRNVSDSVGISDFVTRAAMYTRQILDSAQLSDFISRSTSLIRLASDTVGITTYLGNIKNFIEVVVYIYLAGILKIANTVAGKLQRNTTLGGIVREEVAISATKNNNKNLLGESVSDTQISGKL